jgi:bifunctional DNA-binding transcriptional regulator/antitoxin component of YhaV-PrlF toxin-antitoxin module
MSEQFKFEYVDTERAYHHGGSIRVTIPSEIVNAFGISAGDNLAFFIDEQHKVGIVVPARHVKVVTSFGKSSLGFSISDELLKNLLVHDRSRTR